MYSIADLQTIIAQTLLQRDFPTEPSNLYDPIRYFLSIGGKRLRPVLTLLATDLFGEKIEKSLSAALAIEVFHNFTLMHDDIMDEAPLRRGKDTVHKKWDTNTAILSGDAMMITSYQLLSKSQTDNLSEVLHIFSKMALEVCEGQQLDMDFGNSPSVTEEDYLQMIRLKTSVLLGAALEIGALIAGANPKDRKLLYEFGVNMGIAFQLQDDLLDIYGDPKKFGKQIGGDIIENKKTFLLINAIRLTKGKEEEKELKGWIKRHANYNVDEKINAITSIYNKYGIKTLAEEKKSFFSDQAFQALEKIDVPANRKQVLITFTKGLFVRES
ncbi:polyprenyl synthetase family protein [Olivibacter domesticus]|uniref:Geranylgeranyl diphosphate synthase, type II n=1 Tax=Olivibacter domesticus TaxID=407022 RepID=A0A1H7PP86_OLID1|nr:polyprenyl synthetase family protein [Olivibacter domesticus]SEL37055.1 geranylgeranyl diphosphate synthase, type II [Olivibacter domesticus]